MLGVGGGGGGVCHAGQNERSSVVVAVGQNGRQFPKKTKRERERETDYLLWQFDKYSHYPFQFN